MTMRLRTIRFQRLILWHCATVLTVAGWSAVSLRAQETGSRLLSSHETVAVVTAEATKSFLQSRTISLDVSDSSIGYIIRAIARQANLKVVYDNMNSAFAKRISIHLRNATVMDAFIRALQGTGLVAKLAADGETIMIAAPNQTPTKGSAAETGTIQGKVIDSASGKGIKGATVMVPGTSTSTVTAESGAFTLTSVPEGKQIVQVKLFGYRAVVREVVVLPNKPISIQIRMNPVATQLSGVVTTVTGEQRKVEVGNDITTVKVDEIIKTMPVATMSELLATRVPGLYAAPTSGAPGAPTRIRIRGLSSINASNDPIIIIDGVRVYSDQLQRSRNMVGPESAIPTLVSSAIDLIDVNNVETVEVLKGPSAVALYGSEAANGVIVVTSKRGTAGAVQWSVQTQLGTTSIPGRWPSNYWMWGHYEFDPLGAIHCLVDAQSIDLCIPDSLVTYQILNDPSTTAFGRGQTQTYRADVRGGSRGMTYALSASTESELGLVKMPDADVKVLRNMGAFVPKWQRRPQGNKRQSGQATVGLDVGPASTVTFTTNLTHNFTQTTPMQDAINQAEQMDLTPAAGIPDSARGSGLLYTIPNFRFRTSSTFIGVRNALDARTNLFTDLTLQGTGGIDLNNRKDLATFDNGACFGTAECNNSGIYNTGQGVATVTTINLRASKPIALDRGISARTSIGANYTRSTTNDVRQLASGLPAGATSSNGASTFGGDQTRDDRSTAGIYMETVLGFGDRFYLPLALRKDAGSALGSSVAPLFPKLSFSYLASDEPWFRTVPMLGRLSTLRLRLAYGQAGVQPAVDQRLRTYRQETSIVDGTPVTVLYISTVGNTQLKPERSREYEGGFDTDFLNDRMNLSVTWYRKNTFDMLVTEQVPYSAGFNAGSQQFNLGDVKNNGLEVSVGGTLLQHRAFSVHSVLGLSQQQNRLLRFGSLTDASRKLTAGSGQGNQFVVGYPLYGLWAIPIVGYADRNGNGFIERSEVLLSDSSVYVGAPYPKFTANLNSTITLFTRVTVGTTVSYQSNLTQTGTRRIGLTRTDNDPNAPLGDQAFLRYGGLGVHQTVSVMRFDALSLGYIVPHSITRSFFGSRSLTIALQGRNVGLWTNYRGKDPNVNSGSGEGIENSGVLPQPRLWQLSLGIN